MQETDLQAIVESYLQAFDERDLATCVDFYSDDATIDFHIGVFQGKEAIERWHRERFAADFRMVDVQEMTVKGNTVVVEAVASSKKLRMWRIKRLRGKSTFRFEGGKIEQARFTAKMSTALEAW